MVNSKKVGDAQVSQQDLADAAQLSSLSDETPEGRSIVVLAKQKYNLRGRELAAHEAHFIPFSAQTRMSGVDIDGRLIRKGAVDFVGISHLKGFHCHAQLPRSDFGLSKIK